MRTILIGLLLGIFSNAISQPMSGYYSIGTEQFSNFNAAVDSLIAKGVSGPVTFIINPGIYNENITIPEIEGASETNTITFRPKESDSTSVTLISNATETILLDGADYIHFLYIGIKTNNHHCISFQSEANNNMLSNCIIEGGVTSFDSISKALIYSDAGNDTNNVFSNNHLIGGSYGFYYQGETYENGTLIKNNIFDEQYYFGIRLSNQYNPQIVGNTLNLGYNTVRSIYCNNSKSVIILRNKSYEGGIMLEDCHSSNNQESIIANNFAISKNSSAIVQSNSSYIKILFNSTYLHGNTQTRGAIYSNNTSSSTIMNNIIASFGSGCAYYIHSGYIESDNNLLYSNNLFAKNNTSYINNFSNWQMFTNNDANSYFAEPEYMSNNDLHLSQGIADGNAQIIPEIEIDIDGDTRSANAPDIGADEFLSVGFEKNTQPEFDIYVFPNPVNEKLTVVTNTKEHKKIDLRIINLKGRLISSYSFYTQGKKETFKYLINKSVKKGVYILEVLSEGKLIESHKIIIN